jgi:hypothetical protein
MAGKALIDFGDRRNMADRNRHHCHRVTSRREIKKTIGHHTDNAMMARRFGIVMNQLMRSGRTGKELDTNKDKQEQSGDTRAPRTLAQPIEWPKSLHGIDSQPKRQSRGKDNYLQVSCNGMAPTIEGLAGGGVTSRVASN